MRKSSSSNYFLPSNYFVWKETLSLRPVNYSTANTWKNINFIHAKKERKKYSHTYNKKNHPTHRLGEQQKNTHLHAFIHGDNNPTLRLVSKGWHETHDDKLFVSAPANKYYSVPLTPPPKGREGQQQDARKVSKKVRYKSNFCTCGKGVCESMCLKNVWFYLLH